MTLTNTKPNIIFIALDTLRSDRLSCYGYEKPTSPNIDKFAENAILFENAIASSCWTLPSHASMFTGLLPVEHGATDEHLYLDDNIPTLAELLADFGYSTFAYSEDNGWLIESTNLMKGFQTLGLNEKKKKTLLENILDRFARLLGRRGLSYSQRAISAVEKQVRLHKQGEKPFFTFVNLMDTHMPYKPEDEMLRRFGLEKAERSDIEFIQKKFQHFRTMPETLSEQQFKLIRQLYDVCVATVDQRLRNLMKLVMKKQNRDNTVVVITSDHGECLGEHGLLGHWFSLCDTLIKIPLILYTAGRSKPARVGNVVQQSNIFHTLLDLAGYDRGKMDPKVIKYKSLISSMERDVSFGKYVYSEHAYPKMTIEHIHRFNPSFNNERLGCAKQAIRSNEYKYIRFDCGHEELYDLKKDSAEMNNVINEKKEVAKVMRNELEKNYSRLNRSQVTKNDEVEFEDEIQKRLRDLGYL